MTGISEPQAKRAKKGKRSPLSIVTWNCNGFTTRCMWNSDLLRKLLNETKHPDLICLQEVRLKALNPTQRGRPTPNEYAEIKPAMTKIFCDYIPVWSLADKKYAGTCTLVHKRLNWHSDGDDWDTFSAFTTDTALDLLLTRFSVSRSQVAGLKPAKKERIPTNKLVIEKPKPKQTAISSFFAPKPQPKTEKKSPNTGSSSGEHHHEGRFQFFCLDDMDVLQTYVPNNGMKEEAFERRRMWDEDILRFLKDRQRVLDHVQKRDGQKEAAKHNQEQDCKSTDSKDRPLLWCGDLNVAKEYTDGTHWQERVCGSNSPTPTTIYEWWTDEKACLVYPKPQHSKRMENTGIASFTPAERRRFRQLLDEADMVDVWRELHPQGVTDEESCKLSKWERPNYTWRGHLGKNGGFSKYQGKGQRLDYFLLAPSKLISAVKTCRILGYGEQREGLFCGSDHCATMMTLEEEL